LGSSFGAVVRELTSHKSRLGSTPAWCHIQVYESSLLFKIMFSPYCEGFSLGSPVFLPPEKPTFPTSNSIRIEEPHEIF